MESSGDSKAVYCNQFHRGRAPVPYHGRSSVARGKPGSLFEILLLLTFFLRFAGVTYAADLPPRPSEYFNDLDSLVKKNTAERLNRELADFQHQTSNQLFVVIYPKLPNGVTIGKYGAQLVNAWKLEP